MTCAPGTPSADIRAPGRSARPSPPHSKITGQVGYYPIAALCQYDLKTGRQLDAAGAVPPELVHRFDPGGWRVWRDEKGGLHGVHDGAATSPGMYQ